MEFIISAEIIAIAALLISLISAIKQLTIAQQANTLSTVVTILKEYRSPEFKEKIFYIHKKLKKNHQPEDGLWAIPESDRETVLSVCHLCDTLGALVVHDIVSEKLIISYIGGSIDALWKSLEDYIKNERKIRNSDYQQYFEHLVSRIRKLDPEKIRQKLRLEKLE